MSEASWSGLSNSGTEGKQKIKVWSKGSENLQQVTSVIATTLTLNGMLEPSFAPPFGDYKCENISVFLVTTLFSGVNMPFMRTTSPSCYTLSFVMELCLS